MAALIPGKLLYLRTPHTASVATERSIVAACGEAVVVWPGHVRVEQIRDGHGRVGGVPGHKDAREYLTGNELLCTTIRNPYDVLVTMYLRVTKPPMSFEQFVETYEGVGPHFVNGEIFYHAKHCDVVMRYENLAEEFAALMSGFGLTPELAVDNVTPGKRPWQTYYSDKSLESVNRRFGEEIRWVGYPLIERLPAEPGLVSSPTPRASTDA